MFEVTVALLAAYLQQVFLSAVTQRDGVRLLRTARADGTDPDVSALGALRADAGYYLRQLRHRQPQPDIERKRLGALGGIGLVLFALVWLLLGGAA